MPDQAAIISSVSLRDLPDKCRQGVIAIGNFDGVHRGHQALLSIVREKADRLGVKAGVLTFEPHPRALFRPDDPPFRITPQALKERRMAEAGMDFVCSLPFDWDFASQTADAFIDNVLRKGLQPAHIVIGHDFRFGQLRRGTADTLRDAGFQMTIVEPVGDGHGLIYSSSLIREALRKGDIDLANTLLGYEWEIEGIVEKGDQRGRELGYPTANVPMRDVLHPAYGIYATFVQIVNDGPASPWLQAATNIGIRPMFEVKAGRVEAHILDFNRDIYGRTLRVRPVKRLRGEAKFDSLEALIAQIDEDCRQARAVLDIRSAEQS